MASQFSNLNLRGLAFSPADELLVGTIRGIKGIQRLDFSLVQ
ncbi:hypothetical protein S7335_365 [Synechococcus sp. PCC 7335]|nr:hypothetical protein S7335_365 [Synechococcus sp. PCC 7335]